MYKFSVVGATLFDVVSMARGALARRVVARGVLAPSVALSGTQDVTPVLGSTFDCSPFPQSEHVHQLHSSVVWLRLRATWVTTNPIHKKEEGVTLVGIKNFIVIGKI